jgi:hypothetical protein
MKFNKGQILKNGGSSWFALGGQWPSGNLSLPLFVAGNRGWAFIILPIAALLIILGGQKQTTIYKVLVSDGGYPPNLISKGAW